MTFVQFVVLGPDENYGLDDVDGVVDEVMGLMFEYEYDLNNLMMLMMLVGWMMLMEALSLSLPAVNNMSAAAVERCEKQFPRNPNSKKGEINCLFCSGYSGLEKVIHLSS